MKSASTSTITRAYLLALSIIALLATGRVLLEHEITARQTIAANIINTAGRQRMRTQRIAWMANEFPHATPARQATLRQEIQATVESLSDSHRDLTTGKYKLDPHEPLAGEISQVYNGAAWHLDADVKEFIADTQAFLADTTPETRMADTEKIDALAFRPLLNKLDKTVDLYQTNSDSEAHMLSNLSLFSYFGVLIVLLAESVFIFRPTIRRVDEQQRELLLQASTDPLTGSFNRRTFFDIGQTLLANAQRQGTLLGALGLDIDHFKKINDTYGHACGDEVLKIFVLTIAKTLRQGDVMGRIGGEEFSVLLPAVDEATAVHVGDKLRKAIEDTAFMFEGKRIPVTVSIGAAGLDKGDNHPGMLLQRADKALYAAKHGGRNRVTAYSSVTQA